jgi:hypothetical protein
VKPKTFHVQTRLASLAFTAGGISIADALGRADKGLAGMGEASLLAMDAALLEMETRFGPAAAGRETAPTDDLYGIVCCVIDMSGALRHSGLDQAAKAFCDLIDLSAQHSVWDWPAVDLHMAALRMLRAGGEAMTPRQRAVLLDGLLQVARKRVGEPPAAETA